jgi:hypothetical protein
MGITDFGDQGFDSHAGIFCGCCCVFDVGDGSVSSASYSSREQSRYHVVIAADKLGSQLITTEPQLDYEVTVL